MMSLMQDRPLLISSLIDFAADFHGDREIVTQTIEGTLHRSNYRTIRSRAKRGANALTAMDVRPGDRIATLAWNTHRHLELYFAVSGMGAILHTVNPRLFPEQIEYILNHAEDSLLFFDSTFLALVEWLAPRLATVRGFILLTDRQHMPAETSLPNLICYEDWLTGFSDYFEWPTFDERTASSLCYTSGTTGSPKGVLYGHRSTVLHSFAICARDGFNVGSADNILLVVPLFHANAWGIPYAAAMCGAKMVLPGRSLDGESLLRLLTTEQCNFSLGVPTVWLNFLQYIDQHPHLDLSGVRLERVGIGGAAVPRLLIERFNTQFHCKVMHAWGMTETSPVGTIGNLLAKHQHLSPEQQTDLQLKQGRALYGVDLRAVNEESVVLPRDGRSAGNLMVRGHWVASGYYRDEAGAMLDADGYFPTGDVASIDTDGYMQISDRSKDVIKSGGEWISSIHLENAAVGHPSVHEAAVIGIPHPRWQERPLLLVVLKPGATLDKESILEHLRSRVARFWLPDEILFVEELPHTATGKILKTKLRELYRDFRLSTD